MLNLSYRYDQNSTSLKVDGLPDMSDGDSDQTIGILSSWSLKIIGFPLLEGKREHLDNLMQVVLKYSRYYVSGFRESFISPQKTVVISPSGCKHKLLLVSTQEGVEPLGIVLDDSELADLTRCLDSMRFDEKININWSFKSDKPLRKGFAFNKSTKSYIYQTPLYSMLLFGLVSGLLLFVPIEKFEYQTEDKALSSILINND